MLHVVLADGSIEEVAGAVAAGVEGTELICRNAAGEVVKSYQHLEALMYGSLEWVLKAAEAADETLSPSFRG